MKPLLAAITALSLGALVILSSQPQLVARSTRDIAIAVLVVTAIASGSLLLMGKRRPPPMTLREMEEKGLLVSTDYRAVRAFAVEEFEDEGPHYFLELDDSAVLYLNGQYLYDYEPIDDDPEANQPRRFPCTEFTVRRHREGGYVVDLVCRGRVLEPEVVAPHFSPARLRWSELPGDGQVFRDRPYDDLKRALAGA